MVDANLKSDSNEEVAWCFMKFLSDRRKELNLSVRDLGKKANVSYTVIYDLEQRRVLPKLETLLKMANALDLYVDIKLSQEGLNISFNFNESGRANVITRYSKISADEQLSKILGKKGLPTKEIEEIKDFIEYKLGKQKVQ